MRPCKRLVTCLTTPYIFTGRLHGRLPYYPLLCLFSFHGRQCKGLVACYWFQCRGAGCLHGRLCRVRGLLGKSYPGRVNTASSSNPSKCLVACSIFNGRQGGRLSRCRRIIMYMYFSLWILVSQCF